ncbi:hypothetical protein GFS24_28045 [Chitinophaga sp. SYP-B3965]|nr:hypothetical protein [Chitinophaga sp. SYP-B3965]
MPQLDPAGTSRGYEKFNDPEELDYHFQLFLAGNQRSSTIICERLYALVFGFCFYSIQDRSEAKIIVNDAISRLWERREKITDFSHARNSIRKAVEWACRNSKTARRKMLSVDFLDDSDLAVYDPEDEEEQRRIAANEMENNLLIEKAIPYLPPSRKIIMELVRRGLKPKEIAERIRESYQFVTEEIKQSIKDLKISVPRIKKASESSMRNSPLLKMNYKMYVSKLQVAILDLYIKGLEFNEIARELYITPWKAMQQFYKAMRKLNSVVEGKSKRKFKF